MKLLSDSIKRKYIDTKYTFGWNIETAYGLRPIDMVSKTVPYDVWRIETKKGLSLEGADNHILFDNEFQEKFICNFHEGEGIKTKKGNDEVTLVKNLSKKENMFDISVNSFFELTLRHELYNEGKPFKMFNELFLYWLASISSFENTLEHYQGWNILVNEEWKPYAPLEWNNYISNGIVSHNSTSVVCFLLWFILFNKSKKVALLANKAPTARVLLERIKLAYSNLPLWLQVGIVDWNKSYITLENGSSITAAASSSDSIRGDSFACVFVDECVGEDTLVTILDKETNKEQHLTIKELFCLL